MKAVEYIRYNILVISPVIVNTCSTIMSEKDKSNKPWKRFDSLFGEALKIKKSEIAIPNKAPEKIKTEIRFMSKGKIISQN
jgi:hypothetical protein